MARFEDHFLTRREVLRVGSVAVTGYHFLPVVQPQAKATGATDSTEGKARFCIFVMLEGGQSHVDAWDFKEGPWTPEDFAAQTLPGVGKWPMGLYPELAQRRDKYSLMRSMATWESQRPRPVLHANWPSAQSRASTGTAGRRLGRGLRVRLATQGE